MSLLGRRSRPDRSAPAAAPLARRHSVTVRSVTAFVLIGSGWRARMFLQVAAGLDTVRCEGVVVRTPRRLEVPAFTSLDSCLREVRPDFVLTATPRPVTPSVIVALVDRGLPVLAETPPAPDLDGLRTLWSAVGGSGLVQVAEQYLLMPAHAARAALVATGAIGAPTQVQVSSTRILADFLHDSCTAQDLLDVLRFDAVPRRRRGNLHRSIVLRND